MMMENETENAPHLDALLPPEMARRAEEIGARKVAMDAPGTLVLAVLAGAFIALGGVFATTALAGAGTAPVGSHARAGRRHLQPRPDPGHRRRRGAVHRQCPHRHGLGEPSRDGPAPCSGTGLSCSAATSSGPRRRREWSSWAASTTSAAALSASPRSRIAHAKLQLGFGQAVALGILCNALVCLAVWLSYSARTTADRILAIVPPISAFVAAGFEHSIANMYFVPLGLLIARPRPGLRRGARSRSPRAGPELERLSASGTSCRSRSAT